MLLTGNNFVKRTHYEVLSVKEDATYDEIRASYKAAVLNSHPDKLHMEPKAVEPHKELHEKFLDVQKAWQVLCDPKSRANYDCELRASRQELEVAADEIKLDDMAVETIGDAWELFYQCRCGDYFSVTSLELEKMGVKWEGGVVEVGASAALAPASILLPCGSCSLKIRLTIDVDC